jgi:hypothetical protein
MYKNTKTKTCSLLSKIAGFVPRHKMLCGNEKPERAIHGDGQGLLGQCILAAVAILGTLEQMLEHAIVHILRHRRQIERLLNTPI